MSATQAASVSGPYRDHLIPRRERIRSYVGEVPDPVPSIAAP